MDNGYRSSVIIKGLGSYIPSRVLTNSDIARMVDTSDEWIQTRTGIKERRIAENGENCSDMAAAAGRKAIAQSGLDPAEIDFVIVATCTPDMPFPSTACLVQKKVGLGKIPGFDMQAACSGFLYGMSVATQMIRTGTYRNILLVGAEKLSAIIDWQDRATCVLFGDGAGAAVLSRTDVPDVGIIRTMLGADGALSHVLRVPGGGSACPATIDSLNDRQHYIKMEKGGTYKNAVRVMEQSASSILERQGMEPEQISCVIPHQANVRIIESISIRLGIPMDKFIVNLDRFGNTSAATIPLALDEANRQGRLQTGDNVLLVAFGAGLTWASSLIKWH